ARRCYEGINECSKFGDFVRKGVWEYLVIKRDFYKALGENMFKYDWISKYSPGGIEGAVTIKL
ncbi:MAG: hypothetical protein NTV00_06935, partial [Methylococcales bacterium]|nr:hypothetical protein [Methylococcales bacterium]